MSRGILKTAHATVMLDEAVSALNIQPEGIYVDATFGRGGHSRRILSCLSEKGQLIGFDKDPDAIREGELLAQRDKRFQMIGCDFSMLAYALRQLDVEKINGILFDLGVSSPQLDDEIRGFSFRYDVPLDMRMDTRSGMNAAEWLAVASETEIRKVVKDYGEERFAGKIAAAIVARRAAAPIKTTGELSRLVAENVRTREQGKNPATRTFQAIRIHINQELTAIEQALPQAIGCLTEGGMLVVISFHSLEDRLVKHFIRRFSEKEKLPKWIVLKDSDLPPPPLRIVTRMIKPSAEEVRENPRARSAVLRSAQRTSGPWNLSC